MTTRLHHRCQIDPRLDCVACEREQEQHEAWDFAEVDPLDAEPVAEYRNEDRDWMLNELTGLRPAF